MLMTEKTQHKSRRSGTSLRAILLALILIPVNIYWITVIEVRWYALDGTCLPIFVTPIFILFVLAIANLSIRQMFPRFALEQGELLVIYIMIVTGSVMASHDMFQNLFGTIAHPARMATPSNGWRGLWFKYLPSDLFVFDPKAVKGFYEGGMNPWRWEILQYWIKPLSLWALLMTVLMSMMMSINILIRKQWTENEKLTFPLVRLPLAMTDADSKEKFYKNRMMWIGFSIPVIIGIVNGLHVFFPSWPQIQGIKMFSLTPFITTRPWSAATVGGAGLSISMYPFIIGLVYFIPLDLSFSCWFFYVARKVWQIVGAAQGWDSVAGTFPYFEEQSAGAWITLGILVAWGTRKHVMTLWKSAWRKKTGDSVIDDEAKIDRGAFITIGLGMIFLMFFSDYFGLSRWVAFLFFAIYFILAIGITRVRAELGTPHEIVFVNPVGILVNTFGLTAIGPANLTILSSMYWFNRCYRSHPMPNQLESFKMAEGTNIRMKPLIGVIALATVVGIIATFWANMQVTYSAGAQAKALGFKSWVGAESFDRLTSWMQKQTPPETVRMAYMVVGGVIVFALRAVRGSFIWWPFHPAGYALAVSYAMDYFWFAFFVGWAIKSLIVKFGGMKLHNTLLPLFLGLILGDFTIGSIWAIIGPLLNVQAYKIFI
ncbi:MAG: DUF6785 family protein [Armatimonadota bacterium]